MRPLTDEETRAFFTKLSEFLGHNISALLDREDEPHCFRLHKDRVYYLSERLMRAATTVSRDDLESLGICFGKFTKSRNFRLKVTCLDYVAQHAKFKVWLKPSAEMSFLYGNHVVKAGVGRMTEAIPQYAGVVVLSLSGIPLGFGRASQGTDRAKDMDPTGIVVLHQADIGEYLREETELG
jgi:60S ribosome subunit biogenesis protein NIP7